MRDRDEWDDDGPEDDDEEEEEDDADEIAIAAVQAWLDIDGDDELAQAQRESLAAIAQEALALKERREERERQRAFSRKLAQREEQRAQERAELACQRREARKTAEAERERREARERQQAAHKARHAAPDRAAIPRAADHKPASRRGEEGPPTRGQPRRTEQIPAAPTRPRVAAPVQRRAPRAVANHGPPATRAASADVDSRKVAVVGRVPTSLKERAAKPVEPLAREMAEQPQEPLPAVADLPVLTGADLVAWRKRLGLTQQAAADVLGVRQGTISKAESRIGATLGPALRDALAAGLHRERRPASVAAPGIFHGNTPGIPE